MREDQNLLQDQNLQECFELFKDGDLHDKQ